MAKYCGVISVGAVAGGGHLVSDVSSIPIAVELVSFKIGEKFFRKIRLCEQMLSQFVHQGDDACVFVYKQLGITNVIVGIKSKQYPSYCISFARFLLMIFAQYFIGSLICFIPALILFGRIGHNLPLLGTIALPTYGSWTLVQAYREMQAPGC